MLHTLYFNVSICATQQNNFFQSGEWLEFTALLTFFLTKLAKRNSVSHTMWIWTVCLIRMKIFCLIIKSSADWLKQYSTSIVIWLILTSISMLSVVCQKDGVMRMHGSTVTWCQNSKKKPLTVSFLILILLEWWLQHMKRS